MSVGLIHTFLLKCLAHGLIDVIILKVGHIYISFGNLGASVHHYGWHIWVGVGVAGV